MRGLERFTKILSRQLFECGQRILCLFALGNQAQRVVTAYLQQGNLIQAIRDDALAIFSSHISALKPDSVETSREAGRT